MCRAAKYGRRLSLRLILTGLFKLPNYSRSLVRGDPHGSAVPGGGEEVGLIMTRWRWSFLQRGQGFISRAAGSNGAKVHEEWTEKKGGKRPEMRHGSKLEDRITSHDITGSV